MGRRREPLSAAEPSHAVWRSHLTLETTEAGRLISVTTSIAERSAIHAVETGEYDLARMRALDALDLQADVPMTLAPGGMHIMLIGLPERLVEGTSFPLTLTFETAGDLAVDVPVLGIAASGPGERAK